MQKDVVSHPTEPSLLSADEVVFQADGVADSVDRFLSVHTIAFRYGLTIYGFCLTIALPGNDAEIPKKLKM